MPLILKVFGTRLIAVHLALLSLSLQGEERNTNHVEQPSSIGTRFLSSKNMHDIMKRHTAT